MYKKLHYVELGPDVIFQGVEIMTPLGRLQIDIDDIDLRVAVVCPRKSNVTLRTLGPCGEDEAVYDIYISEGE